MTHPPRYIPRAFLLAVVALVLVGASAATATAATAKRPKPPCWKTLINDWYDGRIDGTYAIHCYRDALKHLPTDVDTYSSARDDIKQALRERITQSHGGAGNNSGPPGAAGGGGKNSGGPGGGTAGGGTAGGGTAGGGNNGKGPFNDAIKGIGPSKADSVPIPLIVLGAVALLLMAAGGAGFLARRMRNRKLQLATAASLPQASVKHPDSRR